MGTRLSLAKRLEACVSHDPNFICTENTCCSIREWCTTPSRFIFIFKFPQTRRAKRVWVSLYGKGKQLDYYMHAALVELHQICHFIIPNFNLRDSLQILQLSLDGTSNQSKSWNCYKSADTSTPSHAFCHLLNLRTLLSHGLHGNLPAVLGRPKLASCWNIYICRISSPPTKPTLLHLGPTLMHDHLWHAIPTTISHLFLILHILISKFNFP